MPTPFSHRIRIAGTTLGIALLVGVTVIFVQEKNIPLRGGVVEQLLTNAPGTHHEPYINLEVFKGSTIKPEWSDYPPSNNMHVHLKWHFPNRSIVTVYRGAIRVVGGERFLHERWNQGTTMENTGHYTDDYLEPNMMYYYRVCDTDLSCTKWTYFDTSSSIEPPYTPVLEVATSNEDNGTLVNFIWSDKPFRNYDILRGNYFMREVREEITSYIWEDVTSQVFDKKLLLKKPNTTYELYVVWTAAYYQSQPSQFVRITTADTGSDPPSTCDAYTASQSRIVIWLTRSPDWPENTPEGQIVYTSNADKFAIYRSSTGNNDYTLIGYSIPPELHSKVRFSYSDDGLTAGTKYYYRVHAIINGVGASAHCETIITIPTEPPPPVTNVRLEENDIEQKLLRIGWTYENNPPSSDKMYFILWHATQEAGPYKKMQTIGSSLRSAWVPHSSLRKGAVNYFHITTSNYAFESAASNTVSVAMPPASPDDDAAILSEPVSQTEVRLSWNPIDNDDRLMRIQRSPSGDEGSFTDIHTTSSPSEYDFVDSGLLPDTEYFYRIFAFNVVGESPPGAVVTVRTLPHPVQPPGFLHASIPSPNRIRLDWIDVNEYEDAYHIEYTLNASEGEFSEIGVTEKDAQSFELSNLLDGSLYTFRVRASNRAGFSAYRILGSIFLPASTPPAPFALTGLFNARAVLQWKIQSTDACSRHPVFVTRNDFSPADLPEGTPFTSTSFEGIAGADALCRSLARSNNLGGTWRAILSDSVTDARDRFSFTGPIVSVPRNGEPLLIAQTLNELWSGTIRNPVRLDQNGDQVLFSNVHSGTRSDGTKNEYGAYCADWTSNAGTDMEEIGRLGATDASWISIYGQLGASAWASSCSSPSRLYCLQAEQDLATCGRGVGDLVESFVIERSDREDGDFTEVAVVPLASLYTGCQDSVSGQICGYWDSATMLPGEEHFYRVRARNVTGDSAPSPVVRVTGPPPPIPSSPWNLQATFVAGADGGFHLQWTDASDNETGFEIERRVPAISSEWTPVNTVITDIVEYMDTAFSYMPFEYRVRAFNRGGYSGWSNVATVIRFPQPPQNLVAAAAPGEVRLTWEDRSDYENLFRILRAEQPYHEDDFISIYQVGPNTTTYTDTSVVGGKVYRYRVYAWNAGGDSAYSNTAEVTALPHVPAAPSHLMVSTVTGAPGTLRVQWRDNATNEDGYKVERSLTGAEGSWSQIATTQASVVTYDDTGLTGNTRYYYRVRAHNAGGDSAYAPSQSAVTPMGPPEAPDALAAEALSSSSIRITWNDQSDNETDFLIERAPLSSGQWLVVGQTVDNVTQFVNTDLGANTRYYYRVRAHNLVGYSAYTATTSAVTHVFIAAPTALIGSSVSSSEIDVSWTDNATNETGFRIERTERWGDGVWVQAGSVAANVTTFRDTGLARNTAYMYRVRAFNSASMFSEYSNEEISATLDTVPAAPSGLQATVVSASQIDLTWADNAENEHWFVIERKMGEGSWQSFWTSPANSTTFSSTGLLPMTTYTFRVRADGVRGYSPYSNEVSATTANAPPAFPYALGATQPTGGSGLRADLRWTDGSHNETGFHIERKIGADGEWTYISSAGANITAITNHNLSPLTTYFYRVRAYNSQGDSPYSNVASLTTTDIAPAAPTNVSVEAISGTQIMVTWNDASQNETGFGIRYRIGETGTWAEQILGADFGVHIVSGLEPNTTYSFLVRAFNDIGSSSSDIPVTATTFEVAPVAPSGLTAATLSQTQIRLVWPYAGSNQTHFILERKTQEASAWQSVATIGKGNRTYTDVGLTNNMTYHYRLKAVNAVGDSAFSNEASALTYDTPPVAPSLLGAIIVAQTPSHGIRLSWTDNAFNETGFTIERKTGQLGTYASIATVGADTTQYLVGSLSGGSQYFFRIKATNPGGSSDYSNEVAVTMVKPTGPQTPFVTVRSDTAVTVRWNIHWQSDNVMEVKVRRSGVVIGTIVAENSALVSSNMMSYLDEGLVPNTTYSYGLETCNAYGCTAWSSPMTVTTPAMFCPNGKRDANEACDDGNSENGDGCSMMCTVETSAGWTCAAAPGERSICQKCGNGILEGTETCDEGTIGTAGCNLCQVSPGWICDRGSPSICTRDLHFMVRQLMGIGPSATPTLRQRIAFLSALMAAERSQNPSFDARGNGQVNRQNTRLLLGALRNIMGR